MKPQADYIVNRHKPKSSPGPNTGSNSTFWCACCNKGRLAQGRKKIGRTWHCKECAAAAAPVEA